MFLILEFPPLTPDQEKRAAKELRKLKEEAVVRSKRNDTVGFLDSAFSFSARVRSSSKAPSSPSSHHSPQPKQRRTLSPTLSPLKLSTVSVQSPVSGLVGMMGAAGLDSPHSNSSPARVPLPDSTPRGRLQARGVRRAERAGPVKQRGTQTEPTSVSDVSGFWEGKVREAVAQITVERRVRKRLEREVRVRSRKLRERGDRLFSSCRRVTVNMYICSTT